MGGTRRLGAAAIEVMKGLRLAICMAFLAPAGQTTIVAAESSANLPPSPCSLRAVSRFAQVVICPPGTDAAGWRQAGKAACRYKGACNAWIWDDVAKAPKVAPNFRHPMSEAQANNAVAVWINRSAELQIHGKKGR